MNSSLRLIALLGLLHAPFAHAQTSNRISIQTGLIHYFFDDSPMMNFKYQNPSTKPFSGLLISSVGLQYKRQLNAKNALAVAYSRFHESYDKHFETYPHGYYPYTQPIVGKRYFTTISLNYYRNLHLNDKLDFVYGGGVNFRTGTEFVITMHVPFLLGPSGVVYTIAGRELERNDIGLNVFGGLDYSPVSWLTLSGKIDFLSSIILYDKEGKEIMKDGYDAPEFPSRFDLSFNLSVGFNF